MNSTHRTHQILPLHYIAELYPSIIQLLEDKQLCKVQLLRVLHRIFPFSPKFYQTSWIWWTTIWCLHKVKAALHLQTFKLIYSVVSIFKAKHLIKALIKSNLLLVLLSQGHIGSTQSTKVTMRRVHPMSTMKMKIRITREILDT